MEQSSAEDGSKQPQDKENATKIDNPVPITPNRRQRRNAFGACSAPVPRPDDPEAAPAIPVAYPAVRPATPGTCRTAHIAAQGSAKSKRLSAGASSVQAVSPCRPRVSGPLVANRPASPPVRRQSGLEGVQLAYAYGQLKADTEPFPEFVDTDTHTFGSPQASTSQTAFDNVGDQSGANVASASNNPSQQRGAISLQEGGQTPPYRARSASRTVIGNSHARGYLPSDTNLPSSPRQ